MNIVFDATRNWYDFFDRKISQERLYYICLEALINCTKYVLHCEDPVFSLYVYKSIERNVIKNVANWEHLSYREVYAYVVYKKDSDEKYYFLEDEIKLLQEAYLEASDELEVLIQLIRIENTASEWYYMAIEKSAVVFVRYQSKIQHYGQYHANYPQTMLVDSKNKINYLIKVECVKKA